MDVNKIFKYVNSVEIKKGEVEATPEVSEEELMAKIMDKMNQLQDEKEAMVNRLNEIEGKQREDLAQMKAEETLAAISKALNIPE
jgi:uncharacterized protein YlxW (UPF0749 family)